MSSLNLYFTIFSFSRVESLPAKSRNTLSSLVLVVQLNFRRVFSRQNTPPTFHLSQVFLPFNPVQKRLQNPKTLRSLGWFSRPSPTPLIVVSWRLSWLLRRSGWGCLVGDWMIWRFRVYLMFWTSILVKFAGGCLCDGLVDRLMDWWMDWLIDVPFCFVLFRSMRFLPSFVDSFMFWNK